MSAGQRPSEGLRDRIEDLAREDEPRTVALADILLAVCDVIDNNHEAHLNAGSGTAEEFGNAYGRHEMAGELADALDEALDLVEE